MSHHLDILMAADPGELLGILIVLVVTAGGWLIEAAKKKQQEAQQRQRTAPRTGGQPQQPQPPVRRPAPVQIRRPAPPARPVPRPAPPRPVREEPAATPSMDDLQLVESDAQPPQEGSPEHLAHLTTHIRDLHSQIERLKLDRQLLGGKDSGPEPADAARMMLANQQMLRSTIITMEILMPPKALRTADGQWDA